MTSSWYACPVLRFIGLDRQRLDRQGRRLHRQRERIGQRIADVRHRSVHRRHDGCARRADDLTRPRGPGRQSSLGVARLHQLLRRGVGDLHPARKQEFTCLERHSRRDIDRLDGQDLHYGTWRRLASLAGPLAD
jgi:hypothetical protein